MSPHPQSESQAEDKKLNVISDFAHWIGFFWAMETYQGAPLVLGLAKLGFLGMLVTHHFHRHYRKPGAGSLAKERLFWLV